MTPSLTPPRPTADRQRVDTSRPHPARRYDYLLGGKDFFVADRRSADAITAAFPTARQAAVENRRYVQRVVTWLAAEAGVRQFLDIGAGIPTTPTVHEIAQRAVPAARILYVDSDPMVVSHGRGRTTSTPQGVVAHLQADLRDPDSILSSAALGAILDLTQPVAVLLCAVLHYVPDEDQPADVVARIIDALPTGSYLALSHATLDPLPARTTLRIADVFTTDPTHGIFRPRTRAQVAALLGGLSLVKPGLVPTVDWRPDQPPPAEATFADTATWAAVARIP